jgi:hypothetical protein
MSYAPSLSYFLDKMSGFSTNYFRLESQNASTASANQIVRFTLPSNALLNLRSFAFHFTATTDSTGGGKARLPPDIASLVERVEVSCGGVQLSAGSNYYNVLCAAKRALTDKMVDPVLGHPEVVRATSYVDGAAKANNETYTGTSSHFCIKSWEGFLGSAEPKIMDSSLVPDLVVSIYLADNSVLSNVAGTAIAGTATTGIQVAGAGTVSYSLSNIHATIECMGLADGTYDNMVSSMIATKGFIEIPFKQYYSFQDTHSGQMRFSVATQSLDRIWAVHRNSNFNTNVGAVSIKGYKQTGAFTAASSGAAVTQDVGAPQFDIGGSLDYNKEKLTTAAFDFPEPAGTNLYQFQLNGAYIPQFRATFEEMYQISCNSVNGYTQNKVGLETMKTNYSVQCIRLNLPESEFGRLISGLNTRSVSLNGYYNISGLSGTPTVNLFAETTATLMIGAGRQISIEA